MGTQKNYEVDRAQNTTSDNLLRGYVTYQKEFINAGFAIHNPEYDPNYEYDPEDPENIRLQVSCHFWRSVL